MLCQGLVALEKSPFCVLGGGLSKKLFEPKQSIGRRPEQMFRRVFFAPPPSAQKGIRFFDSRGFLATFWPQKVAEEAKSEQILHIWVHFRANYEQMRALATHRMVQINTRYEVFSQKYGAHNVGS